MRNSTRLRGRDDGFSLPEVLIVMFLMGLAGTFFYTFLFSAQRSVQSQEQRSDNNDVARLAIERLDREIRSGNVLYAPENEAAALSGVPANYALRVYTQTNQVPKCVQWRVKDGSLERRSWLPPPADPPAALAWDLVTEGIVNEDRSVPPFTLDPSPSTGGRTVEVEILAGEDGGAEQVARIKTSITGRNTTFNYPVTACQNPPAP